MHVACQGGVLRAPAMLRSGTCSCSSDLPFPGFDAHQGTAAPSGTN